MTKKLPPLFILISIFALVCVLSACANAESKITDYTVTPGAEDYAALEALPNLLRVDFTGSTDYENILAYAAKHPEIEVIYTVAFADGTVLPNNAAEADISALSPSELNETLGLLSFLPELERLNCGAGYSLEKLCELSALLPEVRLSASFSLCGRSVSTDETALELTGISAAEAQQLLAVLPSMSVDYVNLGSESETELSWEDIRALQLKCPEADFDYSFTLYGRGLSFETEELDLRAYPIGDEGELISRVVPCMQRLKLLDMDQTGVSDDAMGAIRDANPDVNVIWRVFFGSRYSVRTDVIRILASNPGDLTPENCAGLKYCTKVKYMDLGHNHGLTSVEFIRYMPDLEVCILGITGVRDISPLEYCEKLEFLELETSAINDLRPIANLKNLRYLNVCQCLALHDITPVYGMQLTKLWIGNLTPISPKQVAAFRASSPDTEVNIDDNEHGLFEGWRHILVKNDFGYAIRVVEPRYKLLREQLGYDLGAAGYSYSWNDPLFVR